MNARQKAKKYKRMYEALSKKPVEFQMVRHNVVTLKCDKFYPWTSAVQLVNNGCFDEFIAKDIANDFSREITNNLDRYVDYTMEFVPHLNSYCFRGEIRIVSKI